MLDTIKYHGELAKKNDITPENFLKQLPAHMKGGFGGNTSCVQVFSDDNEMIIDCGSGIRNCIGSSMGKEDKKIHILMTHFHWDHIIGLPFFVPMYVKGYEINFYAVQSELPEIVKSLFKKPYFPVPYEVLESTINFHQLKPREINKVAGFDVTPYLMDHPDECWGFKIKKNDKVFSYCVDNEALRVSREELGEDLPIYQGVDLLIYDAQYSFKEAEEKKNWGHSSAPKGIDIAAREHIKKIVFTHHDPMATDENISQIARLAVQHFEEMDEELLEHFPEWEIAVEGKKLKV